MHNNSHANNINKLKVDTIDLAQNTSEERRALTNELESRTYNITERYEELRESAKGIIKKHPFASVSVAAVTGYLVARAIKLFK